jgi:DNA-binding IclR family transcriptional regulator
MDMAKPSSILIKAFDLLRAFDTDRRVLTLTELAAATGLAKSTTHRIVNDLVSLGMIEVHRTGYRVGLSLMQFAASTPAAGMRDLALPYLGRLNRGTGLTVHFANLRGFEVVYLERLPGAEPTPITQVGARLPANCTAAGKAMLAWENLDELAALLPRPLPGLTPNSTTDADGFVDQLRAVKSQGLARENGEALVGMASLAAPVIVNGFAVAAISIEFDADKTLTPATVNALLESSHQLAQDTVASLKGGHAHWFPRE